MDYNEKIAAFERIGTLEERTLDHRRRLENLEDDNKGFSRLVVVFEQQTEINQKQNETLEKIDNNLTRLNYKFDIIEDRVENLEEKNKIKEKTKAETKKDIKKSIRDKVITFIYVLIIAAIGYFTGIKL